MISMSWGNAHMGHCCWPLSDSGGICSMGPCLVTLIWAIAVGPYLILVGSVLWALVEYEILYTYIYIYIYIYIHMYIYIYM